MKPPVADLFRLLDLEKIEENIFRGFNPADLSQRVFGGQVLAQALIAASRTAPPERACHSLHAYFLRPGDPSAPILYEVDRSRDGGSFSVRRVVAIQHGAQIFVLSASFQRDEGGFEHQAAMPDVPQPEALPESDYEGDATVMKGLWRSRLPVNEAMRIVARESPEPVRSEFHKLVEGLKVGVTLEQGLARMRDSMPTSEVAFFSIVMNIQGKAGGNLSEALGNLAAVLRDRKRLEGKIKAMSSEAKASAGIIGSLPVAVMGLVYLTTPGYIGVLFTTRTGNLLLAGCVFWMSIGVMVMRKMINFKH
jgi:hypothetical protein